MNSKMIMFVSQLFGREFGYFIHNLQPQQITGQPKPFNSSLSQEPLENSVELPLEQLDSESVAEYFRELEKEKQHIPKIHQTLRHEQPSLSQTIRQGLKIDSENTEVVDQMTASWHFKATQSNLKTKENASIQASNCYTCIVLNKFKDVIKELEDKFKAFLVLNGEYSYNTSDIFYSNDFKILQNFSSQIFYSSYINNSARVCAMSNTTDCIRRFVDTIELDTNQNLFVYLCKALNIDSRNICNINDVENFISEIDAKAKKEFLSFLASDKSLWFKSSVPGFHSLLSNINDVDLTKKGRFIRCFLCFLIMLKRIHLSSSDVMEKFKQANAEAQQDKIIRTEIENQIPFFYTFICHLPLKYEKTILKCNLKGVFWLNIILTEKIKTNSKQLTKGNSSQLLVLNILFYHNNLYYFDFTVNPKIKQSEMLEFFEITHKQLLYNNQDKILSNFQNELSKRITSLNKIFPRQFYNEIQDMLNIIKEESHFYAIDQVLYFINSVYCYNQNNLLVLSSVLISKINNLHGKK